MKVQECLAKLCSCLGFSLICAFGCFVRSRLQCDEVVIASSLLFRLHASRLPLFLLTSPTVTRLAASQTSEHCNSLNFAWAPPSSSEHPCHYPSPFFFLLLPFIIQTPLSPQDPFLLLQFPTVSRSHRRHSFDSGFLNLLPLDQPRQPLRLSILIFFGLSCFVLSVLIVSILSINHRHEVSPQATRTRGLPTIETGNALACVESRVLCYA